MVWYEFRLRNESVISWVEFRKVHNRGVDPVYLMDVFASVLLQ